MRVGDRQNLKAALGRERRSLQTLANALHKAVQPKNCLPLLPVILYSVFARSF